MKILVKGNIEHILAEIDRLNEIDQYIHPQLELDDVKQNAEFLNYLDSIAEFCYIETMGKDWSRKPIDLKLSDVIHKSETAIVCGIKVVKHPISKFTEWDLWPGGYIEGFSRMDGEGEYPEFFTWFYIKIDKLKQILTKWENHLYTYKYQI